MRFLVTMLVGAAGGVTAIDYSIPPFGVLVATLVGMGVAWMLTRETERD